MTATIDDHPDTPRPADDPSAPGTPASPIATIGRVVAEAVAAVVVAVVVAAVGLAVFASVHWPAFNSSNVTQAITTVLQVVMLVVLGTAILLHRRRRWPILARVLSWAGLSGLVTTTLGMPLAATNLYLHGISVDQEFRTTFLTRLTDGASLRDMTYVDMPPFYPAGWFWIGGRFANLLGLDGWEAFKPYAIVSIAVAAVLALVLWTALVRVDLAVLVATATTAVLLAYGSPEPYGAIIALLVAPVAVLAWGALDRHSGGWAAVVGTGVFLGVAATFYTLYVGIAAFAVTVMALVAGVLAARRDGRRAAAGVLVRWVVVAAVAGLVALSVWGPFVLAVLSGEPMSSGGSAMHYLPSEGSALPLPMFQNSLLGALCLLGTVWMVFRSGSSRRAQALGITTVAIYGWCLLSMALSALGTTLLGFRLEVVLFVVMSAAGAFAFVDLARWCHLATGENPRTKQVVVALGAIGAIAFTQNIPQVLASDITIAYTDTDGHGARADKRPAGAAAYYSDLDAAILAQRPGERHDTVVLTSETAFLAYYPYYGFQGLTSHYANPLAQFPERAAAIESWADLSTPDELLAAWDALPWRAPDSVVFRRSSEGYTLRLAQDVFPNDPNVRRYTVTFPRALFDDPRFAVDEIGPFAVVTRVG